MYGKAYPGAVSGRMPQSAAWAPTNGCGGRGSRSAPHNGLDRCLGMDLVGTIRSWKEKWGFIVSPENFEGDLFCHLENLDPASVAALSSGPGGLEQALNGATVWFKPDVGKGSRICATNVFVNLEQPHGSWEERSARSPRVASPAPPGARQPARAAPLLPEQYAGQRLLGTVRSWKEKWGFVVCPEVFEGDLFCHSESLQPGQRCEDLSSGMQVEFELTVDAKGRRCASDVRLIFDAAAGFNVQADGGAHQAADASEAYALPEKFQCLAGMRLEGTVRSWKDKWGFIVSDSFKGDLFAHMSYVDPGSSLYEGARVNFEVGVGQKGRPTATHVRVAGAGASRTGGSPAAGAGAEVAVAPGEGRASEEVLQSMVGRVLEGTVRSWKDVWGFVTSPAFQGDIFAHLENTVAKLPLAAGARVSFEVGVDDRGRHAARKIESVMTPEEWVGQGQCTGSIKSWRNDWGFIISACFTGEGLMSRTIPLPTGTRVRFVVERDPKGRLTAKGVVVEALGPGAMAMGIPMAAPPTAPLGAAAPRVNAAQRRPWPGGAPSPHPAKQQRRF
eukprot:TRINITY_DN8908_c0_g1_i1.p1 TRINITY_DN8908_c0_g1~~TRINITY_DN8908_c0_g1_i1.p1  ORF type:complete len:559 (+),score=93.42 TRINITY_DN8908_c0_g1_i1:205-1881(+)